MHVCLQPQQGRRVGIYRQGINSLFVTPLVIKNSLTHLLHLESQIQVFEAGDLRHQQVSVHHRLLTSDLLVVEVDAVVNVVLSALLVDLLSVFDEVGSMTFDAVVEPVSTVSDGAIESETASEEAAPARKAPARRRSTRSRKAQE